MKKLVLSLFFSLCLFFGLFAQSNNDADESMKDLSIQMQEQLEKMMEQMDASFNFNGDQYLMKVDTFFSKNWNFDSDDFNSFKSDFNGDIDEIMNEMKAFMERHMSQFSQEDLGNWETLPFDRQEPAVPAPKDLNEDVPKKELKKEPAKKKKQRETYSL